MTRFNAVLIPLFYLISLTVQASFTNTFSPGGQLNLIISANNPNMIAVPGDRVTSMSSAAGTLTDKKNTKAGAVIFSSVSDKPFTFYIETELGQMFSVNATPRKGEGRSYRLLAEKPSLRPKAKVWETAQPYESMLVSLNRALLQGVIPEGYGPAVVGKSPLTASGLQAMPIAAWSGNSLRVEHYRLVNQLAIPVDLREQDFWRSGTRSVMFSPKTDRLIAGASTSLYVIQTQEVSDGKY